MLDDDFVMTNETKLESLMKVVMDGSTDIAGGELYVIPNDLSMGIMDQFVEKRKVVVSGGFALGVDPRRKMLISKVSSTPKFGCTKVDMVSNFFVAKVEALRKIKWNEKLK